jgi:outer membrane protein assembly factor BamB
MGGQTTAIVYDNQSNVVYIGSKGGGVYKTYNFGVTWHQVGDQDLMVSCMVQDADGTIYVGTGDGDAAVTYNGLDQQSYENSFIGSGIWKIQNDEFGRIASTTPSMSEIGAWSFVNDLAIADGKLFAATGEGRNTRLTKVPPGQCLLKATPSR